MGNKLEPSGPNQPAPGGDGLTRLSLACGVQGPLFHHIRQNAKSINNLVQNCGAGGGGGAPDGVNGVNVAGVGDDDSDEDDGGSDDDYVYDNSSRAPTGSHAVLRRVRGREARGTTTDGADTRAATARLSCGTGRSGC